MEKAQGIAGCKRAGFVNIDHIVGHRRDTRRDGGRRTKRAKGRENRHTGF
jgi:hypothetical protein